jgi:hypothetical protein
MQPARSESRVLASHVWQSRVHDNDFSGCPLGFAEAAVALWDALEAVAIGTCECAADALGLNDTSFFSRTLAK